MNSVSAVIIIMELKGYFLLKIAIMATCCILFVLQSYQEIAKYFMGMTSVASYVENNDKLQFPTVVICLREPFKMDRYALDLEEYRNSTYSLTDIIDNDRSIPNTSQGLSVKVIATYYEGNCFVLRPPDNFTYQQRIMFIGLKTNQTLHVYFVDRGQETCILYASQCGKNVRNGRFAVDGIKEAGFIIARLKAEKRVYPDRY